MTRLQAFLHRACQELGLRIVIPFVLKLKGNTQIEAQALLPELGSANGMLVLHHYDDLQGAASEVLDLGYGYSVLDEPLETEPYRRAPYVAMFCDWGWGSEDEERPDWMA